jgi:hypothetical protein
MNAFDTFSSWLEARIDRATRRVVFAQPLAAGFAYSAYVDTESAGENQVFERALKRSTDPEIGRLIRRHQEDEIRHAALLDEHRIALGLAKFDIPPHLKMVDVLSAAAGGVLDAPMDSDADIVAAYALLYVVEERAVEVFGRSVDVLEETGDLASARLFRSIGADERRHLKYCRAVGRKYAGSDEAFDREVDRFRDVEARVYGQVSRGFMKHMLVNGLISFPSVLGLGLRALMSLADAVRLPAPRLVQVVG